MHAKADLPGLFIFFNKAIVGITQLPSQRFIMCRSEPYWFLAFCFCGMLATATPGLLLFCGNQERAVVAVINILPESNLFLGI
ncbi:hypothetical protein AN2364V1_4445 (plasmid) [Enterobacter cloacae]|nr:hypothetical protein AI2656V1_4856 [Enterobacter cloacae]CAE7357863.1 hypothetical protein AI2657V1_4858 [Enterobacter cloacae]CAE7403596.1 hypothetical protein AI2658V1_4854 [Enterobacter cloacae]CAF2020339.1 hypothetical protein AI2620V1_4476 [Enterobacter cloacae]CAF2869971.1 hypothetical protein AI2939V1_4857 [Enterobacter cloacae]